MRETAAIPAPTADLPQPAGRVRCVAFGRQRPMASTGSRNLPRYRGLLALLALLVATLGPPLHAASGWNVEGLKRRPRMEVRAPTAGWSTLRRASNRRASPAGAPWSDASVLHVAAADLEPFPSAPVVSRAEGFHPPSLAAPPAPSRAPPFA